MFDSYYRRSVVMSAVFYFSMAPFHRSFSLSSIDLVDRFFIAHLCSHHRSLLCRLSILFIFLIIDGFWWSIVYYRQPFLIAVRLIPSVVYLSSIFFRIVESFLPVDSFLSSSIVFCRWSTVLVICHLFWLIVLLSWIASDREMVSSYRGIGFYVLIVYYCWSFVIFGRLFVVDRDLFPIVLYLR